VVVLEQGAPTDGRWTRTCLGQVPSLLQPARPLAARIGTAEQGRAVVRIERPIRHKMRLGERIARTIAEGGCPMPLTLTAPPELQNRDQTERRPVTSGIARG
jgi:hypothetical protein